MTGRTSNGASWLGASHIRLVRIEQADATTMPLNFCVIFLHRRQALYPALSSSTRITTTMVHMKQADAKRGDDDTTRNHLFIFLGDSAKQPS